MKKVEKYENKEFSVNLRENFIVTGESVANRKVQELVPHQDLQPAEDGLVNLQLELDLRKKK